MSEHHPEPDLHDDDSGLLPRVDEPDGYDDRGDAAPTYVAGGARRGRKKRGRGISGCLAVLVALGIVAGLAYVGITTGLDKLKDQFADPEDFSGPGTGSVTFEVASGDNGAAICRNLESAGVVASVDACVNAVNGNPQAQAIQVGYYDLQQEMASDDAVAVLVDPANMIQSVVTVPEGYRVGQIVSAIVKATDFKEGQLTRLLDAPERIGLPAEAGGNPEGYLYPATYTVVPGQKPVDLLKQMVAKTAQVEEELDIAGRSEALGLTPHEIITVASILEYEANNADDYAKVARVIYNRLDQGMALQMDSTVSYVSQREGDVWTTEEERNSDSLYNTYKHTGLPPGPIGSPGEASIEAALNPADGDWLYFVPDFESGTTLFTADYNEHLANVEKAKEFCRNSEEC